MNSYAIEAWAFPEIIVSVVAYKYVSSSKMRDVMESAYVMAFNMQYTQLNELFQADRFRQIDCARKLTQMQEIVVVGKLKNTYVKSYEISGNCFISWCTASSFQRRVYF